MNKGLIGGAAAGAAVLAAVVVAVLFFAGGADPGRQVDDFVARLGLPPQARVDYRRASAAGVRGDIAVAGLRVVSAGSAAGELSAEEVVLGRLDGADWPASVEARAIELRSAEGTVTAASLSMSAIDRASRRPESGRVENVTLSTPELGMVTVDAIELRDFDTVNPVPEHVDLIVRGVRVPLDRAAPPVAGLFGGLGYDRLSFDLDYTYAYDRESRIIRIESVRLAGLDMGSLTLSAVVGGVPPEALAAPMSAADYAPDATLERAELTYDDASLVDRALGMAARDEGLSLETMRGQLIEAVRFEARTAGDTLTKEVLGAIETFLAKPGTIRIVAEPPEPVKLTALEDLDDDPDAVRKLLGLRVEVE